MVTTTWQGKDGYRQEMTRAGLTGSDSLIVKHLCALWYKVVNTCLPYLCFCVVVMINIKIETVISIVAIIATCIFDFGIFVVCVGRTRLGTKYRQYCNLSTCHSYSTNLYSTCKAVIQTYCVDMKQ